MLTHSYAEEESVGIRRAEARGQGSRQLACGRGLVGGLVQLLLAAPLLLVAVVFDALGELLQRLGNLGCSPF